jgi:hypothetical protein
MKLSPAFLLVCAFLGTHPASSHAAVLWTCGLDDNTWPVGDGGGPNASFVQENGVINNLPGSPLSPEVNTQSDNDYYFAGTYSSIIATNGSYNPVGSVTANEESAERAFAGGDLALRYHFNVPASYGPNDRLTVTFDALNLDGSAADPRFGVEIYVNGFKVMDEVLIRTAQFDTDFTSTPKRLSELGIVTGPGADNIVTLKGVSYNAAGGGNWMGVDFVRVDIDSTPLIVNTFTTNDSILRPGESATLSWTLAMPDATVSISPGIGDVTALTSQGSGSISVSPATTTVYTLTASANGQTQTKTVSISVSTWAAIFEAGRDDASMAEFSHENAADDDYFFAGNHTASGGLNQPVDESLNDDTNTNTPAGQTGNPAIGFERALTEADPRLNVWFIPPPPHADPTARHRITVDVLGVGSPAGGAQAHRLEIYLNDKLLRAENSLTSARTIQFEVTGITSGLRQGSNRLSLVRTGGNLAGWINLDHVMMEYAPGDAPPAISISKDPILGTRRLSWTSSPGRTYRVQASTDTGASWLDLIGGFPTSGAPGTSLLFEDRTTPHSAPDPAYRALLE